MYILRNAEGQAVYSSMSKPIYDVKQFGWAVSGNTIRLDTQREWRVFNTLIPVIEYKLRYTAQDRIFLESLKVSDPVIADLFELLDDPRTQAVDVSNSTVREGVAYALDKCRLQFSYTTEELQAKESAILAEKEEV